jgi:beta-lactamase regulating signal transducer with metallopeptidase domain
MLHSAALWAWHTSLDAMPLALAAVALWRWTPVRWRWVLPALFFLRLVLPHGVETTWHWRAAIAPPAASVAPAASDATNLPAARVPVANIVDLLPWTWLAGMIIVAAWLVASQWRLRRQVLSALPECDETVREHCAWAAAQMGITTRLPVRVLRGSSAPAVCGWLSPVLLVPEDFSRRFTWAHMRGMLLHEMAHVRRRDVLWTWLALLVCAVHWFNPFAWLALRQFHADREVACDAAALGALEPGARRSYGEALILCLQSPANAMPLPALAPFFRRFPELQRRLQYIMKPSPPTIATCLFTCLIVPLLALAAFSTARADQRDGDAPRGDRKADAPAARDGENAAKGARDGDQPKAAPRDEAQPKDAPRDGERPRKGRREGDGPKGAARDGDRPAGVARDGDQPKDAPRDGDRPKKGPRDGDVKKEGPRDGDRPAGAARDGDRPKADGRDGDAGKRRDGDRPRDGARDGDRPKAGPRDGDAPRGEAREARDGAKGKRGPHDGAPARDGDAPKPAGDPK